MNCELSSRSLHGYLDGELDAVRAAEFERHLETCSECLKELESQEALRSSLQRAQLRERATPALRQAVLQRLPRPAKRLSTFSFFSPQWLTAAATVLLLLASSSWWMFAGRAGDSMQTQLAAEVIDAHLRSLQPGHLVDVQSTDQHTVKPWFNGKVDFAVPVRDFTDEGFPLRGGRLDVIHGRTVATLIYGRRKHEVNVFVWPETGAVDEASRASSTRGYQTISWRKGGLEFWAVSDLAMPDLEILQHLLAQ
ncbi:MAG TPA: anti-sigma factor [Candidatus Dormibacteraeota bacterium]|nr:anti-sigma factor [Candidatus Dormibacteraeota bacterium]